MVTHDHVIDESRIVVSGDKVRAAMHSEGLTMTQLADRLSLSVSSVSRGMKSPQWLSDNLPTLAEVLHKAKRTLCAAADGIRSDDPACLTRVCGASREGGFLLPSACEVRKIVHSGNQTAWYLCAGRALAPRPGELVVVSNEDGKPDQLYRFTRDEDDRNTVVLLPLDPKGKARVMRKKDRVLSVRVAICPCRPDTGGAS